MSSAHADTVVGEAPDTIGGKLLGGTSGLLLGGFAGGPLGAIAGGLAGIYAGGTVQQAAGTDEVVYIVRKDNGEEQAVRSPKRSWNTGDSVRVVGNRLVEQHSEPLADIN